jgi:hypothetical protein
MMRLRLTLPNPFTSEDEEYDVDLDYDYTPAQKPGLFQECIPEHYHIYTAILRVKGVRVKWDYSSMDERYTKAAIAALKEE